MVCSVVLGSHSVNSSSYMRIPDVNYVQRPGDHISATEETKVWCLCCTVLVFNVK